MMQEIPVYVFAGFLESGKTSFLRDCLGDPYFTDDEHTLVLLCEEGTEEVGDELLSRTNSVLETLDSEDEMDTDHLLALQQKHQPDRVLLEWNGMWPLTELGEHLPENWLVYQIVTTIHGATFELYAANMGQRMLDHIANADLVVINRASEQDKETLRARNLRAMNPRATIFFESGDGQPENYMDPSEPPFDLDAPIVEISDLDYGIWYMDAMNDPDKYVGKTVRITGMVHKGEGFPDDVFVPGRFGMVCCADDVTFVGFLCHSPEAAKLQQEDWVTVTAQVRKEYYPQFRDDGPVLYATQIEPAQKAEPELVYFNS